jgi:hypothetical protein
VRPSEVKRMLFCVKERRIRSFVAGQVMAFVRGWEESQPDLRVGNVSCGLLARSHSLIT